LTGDSSPLLTHPVSLVKNHFTKITRNQFSRDLQIVGNIWDIISNHLSKIYNIGLVVFRNFAAKILHIVHLKENCKLLLLFVSFQVRVLICHLV